MKILVVGQHYWPEAFPSTDICEGLAARGHQVHMVTDVPNYPMGYIFPEYKKGKRRREERNGVKIFRAFTIGRRKSTLFRLLNYYSFSLSSTLLARSLKEDYDVVLSLQTSPIMMVRGALSYGKKRKKKVLFYTMDLWPACLAAGGMGESSPIYQYFGKVSRKYYRRADRILISSAMFREYLKYNFQIEDSKIGYMPQYAPAQFDALPLLPQKDTVDLMFAGNVGAAQSLTTVLHAAHETRDIKNLRWHIVGDGTELENLKKIAAEKGDSQIIFHGRKPPEEMPSYYAMADAMLVTLTADPYIGMTLPAKVQSYMAAGKPILAAANGEIPRVIEKANCGICVAAENGHDLGCAVRQFLENPTREQLGQNAKTYYAAHFSREKFFETLEQELTALQK